jgi:hypothetical protein
MVRPGRSDAACDGIEGGDVNGVIGDQSCCRTAAQAMAAIFDYGWLEPRGTRMGRAPKAGVWLQVAGEASM